jgi:hypothetical protein
MFLIDTDIWLERLLGQIPTSQLLISDFIDCFENNSFRAPGGSVIRRVMRAGHGPAPSGEEVIFILCGAPAGHDD